MKWLPKLKPWLCTSVSHGHAPNSFKFWTTLSSRKQSAHGSHSLCWTLQMKYLNNATEFVNMTITVLKQMVLITLRLRQNGRQFHDDIWNEFSWMKIYKFRIRFHMFYRAYIGVILTYFIVRRWFVTIGPINNIPALVQIMVWRRPGHKPLFEPMIVRLPTHICITRPQWVNSTCHNAKCIPLLPVCSVRYKSKSKSKKTLFNVGQCKQYNISSHLKWVLVADKSRPHANSRFWVKIDFRTKFHTSHRYILQILLYRILLAASHHHRLSLYRGRI